MNLVKHRYAVVVFHFLVWSLVLFFPYLVSDAAHSYSIGVLPGKFITVSGFIHMLLFYCNGYFLYPNFLNKKYWWVYLLSSLMLIISSVQLKLLVVRLWFVDFPDIRMHVLLPSVIAFTISIFYGLRQERVREEKRQQKNAAQQVAMELKLLRSQVNPHFLFNVLTNLISLARKRSDHLEPALLMLSDLMRYSLYETEKKITLQKEVDYINSFISLQKLRLDTCAHISFKVDLTNEEYNYPIEPMLLIPFVENTFKHGTSIDQPFIDISVTSQQGTLSLRSTNHYHETPREHDRAGGIGLANVRSRLNLLYPGRHDLTVDDKDGLFNITLRLKLL